MTITRSITSSITRSITSSISGAITRYFSTLDPVLNSHYVIANPIAFTGDFEIRLDFAGPNQAKILLGDSHATSYYFNVDATNLTVRIAGVPTEFAHAGSNLFDGKLHTITYRLTGTSFEVLVDTLSLGSQVVVPYTGANNFLLGSSNSIATYLDGILANPKFTDNSGTPVTTTFTLGNAPGVDAELSAEGNNTATRVNVALANTENFQLSNDKTQWDNISPDPKQLPVIIEIA